MAPGDHRHHHGGHRHLVRHTAPSPAAPGARCQPLRGHAPRRKRALDINDNVVQGVAEAKLALELGRTEQAREAVRSSRDRAKLLVSQLNVDIERIERQTHDDPPPRPAPPPGEPA